MESTIKNRFAELLREKRNVLSPIALDKLDSLAALSNTELYAYQEVIFNDLFNDYRRAMDAAQNYFADFPDELFEDCLDTEDDEKYPETFFDDMFKVFKVLGCSICEDPPLTELDLTAKQYAEQLTADCYSRMISDRQYMQETLYDWALDKITDLQYEALDIFISATLSEKVRAYSISKGIPLQAIAFFFEI